MGRGWTSGPSVLGGVNGLLGWEEVRGIWCYAVLAINIIIHNFSGVKEILGLYSVLLFLCFPQFSQ
jgi:hypothetical protein